MYMCGIYIYTNLYMYVLYDYTFAYYVLYILLVFTILLVLFITWNFMLKKVINSVPSFFMVSGNLILCLEGVSHSSVRMSYILGFLLVIFILISKYLVQPEYFSCIFSDREMAD